MSTLVTTSALHLCIQILPALALKLLLNDLPSSLSSAMFSSTSVYVCTCCSLCLARHSFPVYLTNLASYFNTLWLLSFSLPVAHSHHVELDPLFSEQLAHACIYPCLKSYNSNLCVREREPMSFREQKLEVKYYPEHGTEEGAQEYVQ